MSRTVALLALIFLVAYGTLSQHLAASGEPLRPEYPEMGSLGPFWLAWGAVVIAVLTVVLLEVRASSASHA